MKHCLSQSLGRGLNLSLTQMRPSVLIYSLLVGLWVWSSSAWPAAVKSFLSSFSRPFYEIFLVHVFMLTQFTRFYPEHWGNKATAAYGISALLVVLSTSILLVLVQRRVLKWLAKLRAER